MLKAMAFEAKEADGFSAVFKDMLCDLRFTIAESQLHRVSNHLHCSNCFCDSRLASQCLRKSGT